MASVGTEAARTRRAPTTSDNVVAVGFVVVAVLVPPLANWRWSWPEVILTIICAAALRELRRRPYLALSVTALATAVSVLGNWPASQAALAFSAAVFLFALRSPRWSTFAVVVGSTLVFVTMASVFFVRESTGWQRADIWQWSWQVLALALAIQTIRATRRAKVERERRAEEVHEAAARRRIVEERVRIARELHDVIAHHVAVVGVQAAVGQQLVGRDDDAAREAMGHVRASTKSVLTELQALLGVLRQDEPDSPRLPVPGLRDIEELVGSFIAAGADVEVHLPTEPPPLSPSADVAAYRLVQEALTNVQKHAAGAHTVVSVATYDDSIGIDVFNDAAAVAVHHTATASTGRGFGLQGMEERIAATGGHIQSGPTPKGGFRVSATIPFDKDGS